MVHSPSRIQSLLLAAALFLLPASASARSPRLNLPQPGIPNLSGLKIFIDTAGLESNGYRPVEIEVTTAVNTPAGPMPLPRDRQIRVVIKPNSLNGTFAPAVSQLIELPAGSTSVRATILMPQSSAWYAMAVQTFEGGELWKDLSVPHLGWTNRNNWDWTETRPAILFVDRSVPAKADRDALIDSFQANGADPAPTYELPDVRTVAKLFPDLNSNRQPPGVVPPITTIGKISDANLLWQIDTVTRVRMLPPAELPARWLELSQADVIVLSLADLELLKSDFPSAHAALYDWLSTGPLLIITGAGKNFARLPHIERLLDLPALSAGEASPQKDHGWRLPTLDGGGEPDLYPEISGLPKSSRANRKTRLLYGPLQVGQSTVERTDMPTLDDSFFLWRAAGQGCVVAIADDSQPFPGNEADWNWIFSTVPDNHWRWAQRNGFSLHRENDDYWKLLIPGVGEAPVWSFLVLVSLFAAAIGPLNYWFLRRAGRLYLLLLTVPAGAAVMTLAIFTYAMFTDGIAIRMRSRSFTDLDQRTGRASAQAWQSYYAALAPSQGLAFPEDTTIFPVVHDPDRRNSTARTLVWDEGQHLRAGYLPSRTTTQLMIQRATKTSAKLVIRDQPARGQSPQAENQLGTALRYLLVCDRAGELCALEQLAAGETGPLVATTPQKAAATLRTIFEHVKPSEPEGLRELKNQEAISFLWNRSRGWSGVDSGAPNSFMDSSLLETQLAAARDPEKYPLSPGTYLAVVARSPIVPTGVPQVREEASLHVIRGSYK